MEKNPKKIEAKLYRKILEVIPIPCVDVVIVSGGKFLLTKRKNNPAKGKWFIPGGRVFKGETLHRAVLRKVKEETGLKNFRIGKLLAVKDFFSTKSAFGPSTHTIDSIFIVHASSEQKLKADSQSSDMMWFSRVDKKWLKFVKEILYLASFE
ncbi:MAG: NUDIX domain-containing protein [Patescibacteria group bacterium]